ncbi:MAG TPA: LLM class flavin-dependent oxidoreductase [Actinomycetota bacterium]|nr:LLM class flavin-dependent oxidoreductase [Actinomycetota bacterium]
MKTGIILPQFETSPEDLLGAARLAEDSGLDSVWVFDNLWGVPHRDRPVLEAWTALAAVAASTKTITVGSLVLRTTLRNRRVLLSMAGTMEMIAPGRVVVGLGIGDNRTADEQLAYGLEYPPPAERAAELERHLDLFRAELPGVPVWVGGASHWVMDLIPKADGWNYWGSVEDFEKRLRRARAAGPDIPLGWGAPKASVEELERLVELGADHAVVAAGAHNYKEKIAMLSDFNPRQGS